MGWTKMKVWTREEVFEGVREVIVDAIGVAEEEIKEEATLTRDLGAESIDFLDIVFRLEKTFSIKIPRGELFPDDILTSAQYFDGGRMTTDGVYVLKAAMPHADLSDFEKDPDISEIPNLFTVKMIVNFVMAKLAV